MKGFSTKYPLLFGVIVFFAALLSAGVGVAALAIVGMSSDAATTIARIVVALVLLVAFRSCIAWDRSLSGLALAAPVLVIVVWNVVYHLQDGAGFVSSAFLPQAVLLALAPGLFEEVIFRGITIAKLREAGKGPWYTLLGSAAVFALVHLTNAAGMDVPSLLVQVLYSFVVGLLLGAIYLRSGDILTVILAHAAIDLSNQVFATHPTTSSVPMLVAFVVVLVIEGAYAFFLMRGQSQGAQE